MPVKLIPCGNFANESEHYACEFIEARLKSIKNSEQWYIFTNLSLSSGLSYQLPSEIDMVAIGTKGIYVIEIKHWNKSYIDDSYNIETIKNEAVKINHKAKMIAGKLRKNNYSSVGFINGLFLLTGNEKEKFKEINGKRKQIEGIEVFSLSEWKEIFLINNELNIQKQDLEKICNILAPSSNIILSRTIRNFQNFTNLELIGDRSGLFHRVFKGLRKPGREKIILNLYDFSAIREKNPYLIAEREFNVFQKLQKSSYLPPVMDSFQEAVNYPGELYFFTYIDPQSPSLFERSKDITWTVEDRILTAKLCFDALKDFHNNFDETVLHRNITPETIRVRSNNEPIFTRFQFARIVGSVTITGFIAPEFKGIEDFVAPEVLSSGLGACTEESDIYSLCKTLYVIFKDKGDFSSVKEVLHILSCGTNSDPFKRASLQEIRENFDLFYKPSLSLSAGRIDVKYWDEDTVKELNGRYYKIINKLGSGNVGCTFKVKEIDGKTGEELSGPYVAKVITNKDVAGQAMEAYAKVRAQTGGNYLAGVLEVRREWENNEITALLKWIEGEPFSEIKGVLPLYLDELKEGKREEILLEWIKKLCEGLSELHRENFIHGDITPGNIIVNKNNVTLTDFDLSTKAGSVPAGGSSSYCSPDVSLRLPVSLSDDIYALSASIFEVLFERSAFNYRGITKKDRGINWEGIDKTEYLRLAEFMDKANNPDKNKRYTSALDVVEKLIFNPDISIAKSKEHYGKILKNIYPFIEIADEILANVVFEENKLQLWQAVELLQQNPDRWHAVITGEGGAGKTTSLLKLYERFLSSPSLCSIPVFISLSRYNHLYNVLTEDRRKDIIWHIIIEEYLNYVPSDKEIRFIKNFFRNKEKTQINNKKLPSYVFLLDGFDEITVDTLGLLFNLNEIKDFMKSVEIIISCRYDLNNIPGWQGLNSLFITPLEDEQIEVFMSSKEMIFRKDLLEQIPLLRNPMMLTLYCNTEKYIKEYYSKEDYDFIYVPRYKAEIIHNFIEYYILRHDKNSPQKKALHRFYLRHLLPRIAYEMESNGIFELSRSILKDIIQEEFILYSSEEFLETYPYLDELISDEILSSLDSSKRQNISEAIRKLKQKYCLLKDTGKSSFYSFIHSEFRDYFSAVYIKEKLQAGIKSGDNTFPELYSRIFPSYLRNMIGELTEEPKRRPVIEKGYKKGEIKETILDRALDLLRSKNLKNMSNDDIGLFIDSLISKNAKEKKQDYRVLNIIEILKAKRVDLSDTDLSYLDLSKSLLNNVMLGHGEINGKLYGANLTGSRINGDNIFPQGHAESVIRVNYSPDGNRIISESFDNITKEWDIKTGKCLETYEKISTISSQRIYSCDHAFGALPLYDKGFELTLLDGDDDDSVDIFKGNSRLVQCLCLRSDKHRIITGGDGIEEWILETDRLNNVNFIESPSGLILSICYSPDEEKILTGDSEGFIREWDLEEGECISIYQGHSGRVDYVSYSPDGNKIVSTGEDNKIKEWNVETGICISTFERAAGEIEYIDYSSDGNRIILVTKHRTVYEWHTVTGEYIRSYNRLYDFHAERCYSMDGKRALAALYDRGAEEWNPGDIKPFRVYKGKARYVTCVSYSNDCNKVISGGDAIEEWDVKTGESIRIYETGTDAVFVSYSPDGSKIISGEFNGLIKEWDVKTGECIRAYNGHSDYIEYITYNTHGNKFLSASDDKTIKEWDITSGECIKTYKGHSNNVNFVSYSSCGDRIVSGSSDKTIKEWDITSGECIRTYYTTMDKITFACHSSDGNKMFFISESGILQEWDLISDKCIKIYKGHSEEVIKGNYSPDGNKIICIDFKKTIKEWDTKTGECIREYKYKRDFLWIAFIGYNLTGDRIILIYNSGEAEVFNTNSGESEFTIRLSAIISACYSPDGKNIVSIDDDGIIQEYDSETGTCLRIYNKSSDFYSLRSYSPDGKKIAQRSVINIIEEWYPGNKERIRTYKSSSEKIFCVSYSPDGKKIISGGTIIEEWDTETGECLTRYDSDMEICFIVYSPDGIKALCGSFNGIVKEIDLRTGKYIKSFESHNKNVRYISYSKNGEKFISACRYKIKEWHLEKEKCIRTYNLDTEDTEYYVCDIMDLPEYISHIRPDYKSYNSRELPDGKIEIISITYDEKIKDWDMKDWDIRTRDFLNVHSEKKIRLNESKYISYSRDGKKIFTCDRKFFKEWDILTGECIKSYETGFEFDFFSYNPLSEKALIGNRQDEEIIEWNVTTGDTVRTIKNIYGLLIQGVDMRYLHPDSRLSDEEKNILKQYGSII